jgi:hypothetical protein
VTVYEVMKRLKGLRNAVADYPEEREALDYAIDRVKHDIALRRLVEFNSDEERIVRPCEP